MPLIKIGISVSLLVYLVSSVDLAHLFSQLRSVHLSLLSGVFLGYLLGQVFSAYKWRLLAYPLGFYQSQRIFTAYYFVGMYFNLFAPSTLLGDLGRGLLLAGPGGQRSLAINSVIADRVSGLAVLLWIGAGALLIIRSYPLPAPLYYAMLMGAGGSILGWWLLPRVTSSLLPPRSRLRNMVETSLAPYWWNYPLLLKVCGLSALFHIFQLGLQYLLALSLSLSIPVEYFLLFIPLVHLLSALPVSFSGIGIREGGYVFFLTLVGVSQEQALALGLLWTTLIIGSGLVGGLVFLFSPEERLLMTKEARVQSKRKEVYNQKG
jgi:uncharacterized membrane protein YbhN (UPF0104 family)